METGSGGGEGPRVLRSEQNFTPGSGVELPRAVPSFASPLPKLVWSWGVVDLQEVTCARARSPGVTLGRCHHVLLSFPQSAVPGPSPVSPGPSDCGWQKPRVGLASCRSRKKVS